MNIKFLCIILIVLASAGCMSKPYTYNENTAFEMLKFQASLSERYPGGSDCDTCRAYIKNKVKPYCDIYREQDFSLNIEGKKLNLKNIIGIINPKAKKYIILSAHYDNRPISDRDKDKNKRGLPCPGANDGASGVAVLAELCKVFHSNPPKTGVVFVFFDGEDYGCEDDTMYLGSKYFAKNMGDIKSKVNYGILLDMIGDKNLNIYIEKISNKVAPELVSAIWKQSKDLGYDCFIPKTKYAISDDHIPLIEVGIKCIDIIDFDYPSWHTVSDTSDKCSPESLKKVGDVISKFIYSDFEF